MKQTFEEADKNGDGLLNIDEVYQLLHKMNVNLPRRKVKQMFQVSEGTKIFLKAWETNFILKKDVKASVEEHISGTFSHNVVSDTVRNSITK